MAYDALLLLSFGGPEGPDDVMPFLENVTRGRQIPPERLAAVATHYQRFGGVSPINACNRALIAALRPTVDLPIYWGNRNWRPLLADTMRAMAADGIRHAVCFTTSAYGGYSSCRQYIEDIARARADVEGAPAVDKLRPFFDHPGFIGPFVDATLAALDRLGEVGRGAHLVFTAHSIPLAQATTSNYVAQLQEASRLVAARIPGEHPWALVWQSRSGPRPRRPGREGCRRDPHRVRRRPPRGHLRPRHRGRRPRRVARTADGARRHPGHGARLRGHGRLAHRRAHRWASPQARDAPGARL